MGDTGCGILHHIYARAAVMLLHLNEIDGGKSVIIVHVVIFRYFWRLYICKPFYIHIQKSIIDYQVCAKRAKSNILTLHLDT